MSLEKSSTNDCTGDRMITKVLSGESKKKFDESWDLIFGKPSEEDWDDEQESR